MKVDGVQDVTVDFNTRTASVQCSKEVDSQLLVKALPERFTAEVKK